MAQLVEKTQLLKWLLGRIRPREFDPNKQYASELLAILVQVGGAAAPAANELRANTVGGAKAGA